MPPKNTCPEHDSLCDKMGVIGIDTAETKRSVEKIMKNHLPHLKQKIDLILWVVSVAFATIAIMVGLIVIRGG